MSRWCNFLLINSKFLYPFVKKSLKKISDPKEKIFDEKLVNSLLKELKKIEKNK